jgi:iron complex outermembrane receptor protein
MFGLNAEYLNAKYQRFDSAGVYIPDPVTGSANVDLTGKRMERAPTFTATLSGDYHLDLPLGVLALHGSLYHSSSVLWDPNGLIRQDAYNLVDGELSFKPQALTNLRVALYGHNLTDASFLQSYLESTYGAQVSYSAPRQYGVRIEYTF